MNNKLNIAIAGLGTVGSSTINLIEKNKNILYSRSGIKLNIVGILAKNKFKDRQIRVSRPAVVLAVPGPGETLHLGYKKKLGQRY